MQLRKLLCPRHGEVFVPSPFRTVTPPVNVCLSCVAAAREKVSIEKWRSRIWTDHGCNKIKLGDRPTKDWFKHWAKIKRTEFRR